MSLFLVDYPFQSVCILVRLASLHIYAVEAARVAGAPATGASVGRADGFGLKEEQQVKSGDNGLIILP